MVERSERRRVAAPPGTLNEVDETRLATLAPSIGASPARRAMILAYRRDPPTTTNMALSVAAKLPVAATGVAAPSRSSLKQADTFLKKAGVLRPQVPP